MHTLLRANPASPPIKLKTIRERARRENYLIDAHPTGDFSLIDARLRLPVAGLEHVGLNMIVVAIEIVRTFR
jgi:hypothetical protein